jgi:hypothetical protein
MTTAAWIGILIGLAIVWWGTVTTRTYVEAT